MKKHLRIIGIIIGGIGVISIIFGVISLASTSKFIRQSIVTTAHVSDVVVKEYTNSKGQILHVNYPVITFKDKNGEKCEIELNAGKKTLIVGQNVQVRYLAKDPSDAMVDNFNSIWLMPIVLISLGLMFLFAGCKVMWEPVRGKSN